MQSSGNVLVMVELALLGLRPVRDAYFGTGLSVREATSSNAFPSTSIFKKIAHLLRMQVSKLVGLIYSSEQGFLVRARQL